MAQFSAKWPQGSLHNMHSSNPEPISWTELSHLVDKDLAQHLQTTPFQYETTQGNCELRESISSHYHRSLEAQNLVLTSGAQEAIFLVMHALLKNGDQVITFNPCFEPLVAVAEQTGAAVVQIPLMEHSEWNIDWQKLESSFSNKTQLLVINFPHNPTGKNITKNDLQRLVLLCEKHDCWLFSDEVFRGLEHSTSEQLPTAVDVYDKAISMGVFSKALALPGIRIGWLATKNIKLIEKLQVVKSHLSICQSSLDVQLALSIIPCSNKVWQRNVKIIESNKAYINQNLTSHKSLFWQLPEGASTGFIQIKNHSGNQFAENLANHQKILVLPNAVFLSEHQGFRIALGKIGTKPIIDQILMSVL